MVNTRQIKFLFLIVLGLGFLAPSEAQACICSEPPTPLGAFREATAVFVGIPTSSRDENESYRYFNFKVSEKLKGTIPDELELYGGWFTSSCYSGFTLGQEYLIYAYGDTKKGLSSQYCQRRPELRFADGEVQFLREFISGKKEPRIYGSVGRLDLVRKTNSQMVTPLEGLKVEAKTGTRKFETLTDKGGLYRFHSLPDGEYQISVEASNDLEERGKRDFVALGVWKLNPDEVRSSQHRSFVLRWDNQINGRVIDSEGKQIRRATVRIFPAEFNFTDFSKPPYEIVDYLSDRGYFLWGMSPGKYYVAAQVRAPLQGKESFIAYLPDSTSGKTIMIDARDNLKLDIQFKELTTRDIEGIVKWPDGTLVSAGNVVLERKENSEDSGNYRYDIAFVKDGRFSIQAFEGGSYWLKVSTNFDGLRAKFPYRKDFSYADINAEQSRYIKVTKGIEPLTIIIPFPKRP